MEVEKKLIFFITHEECEEKVIELYEYDTVGKINLKSLLILIFHIHCFVF